MSLSDNHPREGICFIPFVFLLFRHYCKKKKSFPQFYISQPLVSFTPLYKGYFPFHSPRCSRLPSLTAFFFLSFFLSCLELSSSSQAPWRYHSSHGIFITNKTPERSAVAQPLARGDCFSPVSLLRITSSYSRFVVQRLFLFLLLVLLDVPPVPYSSHTDTHTLSFSNECQQ